MAKRKPPREMLALITLATSLPLPASIRFHPNREAISLTFDSVPDGLAWTAHFDAEARAHVTAAGRRIVVQLSQIVWHGWSVTVDGSDDGELNGLTAETEAALGEIVGGGAE